METLYSKFFQTISDIALHLGIGLILWPTWNCKCSTFLRFGCWFLRPVEGHGSILDLWLVHGLNTHLELLSDSGAFLQGLLTSICDIHTNMGGYWENCSIVYQMELKQWTVLYLAVLASSPFLSGSFGICDLIFCNFFPLSFCLLFPNHGLIFLGAPLFYFGFCNLLISEKSKSCLYCWFLIKPKVKFKFLWCDHDFFWFVWYWMLH